MMRQLANNSALILRTFRPTTLFKFGNSLPSPTSGVKIQRNDQLVTLKVKVLAFPTSCIMQIVGKAKCVNQEGNKELQLQILLFDGRH
jgi:hypothetical protein